MLEKESGESMANDDEILTREELEKRAEAEDERQRLAALSKGGGSESMKELKRAHESRRAGEEDSRNKLWIVMVAFIAIMAGASAFLLLFLKNNG